MDKTYIGHHIFFHEALLLFFKKYNFQYPRKSYDLCGGSAYKFT